jgi:hypothetical protein
MARGSGETLVTPTKTKRKRSAQALKGQREKSRRRARSAVVGPRSLLDKDGGQGTESLASGIASADADLLEDIDDVGSLPCYVRPASEEERPEIPEPFYGEYYRQGRFIGFCARFILQRQTFDEEPVRTFRVEQMLAKALRAVGLDAKRTEPGRRGARCQVLSADWRRRRDLRQVGHLKGSDEGELRSRTPDELRRPGRYSGPLP